MQWIFAAALPDWTPASIIEESVARIRAQVGGERVLAAVSGGVDSSVAAALVHKAIGDQQVAVFVDTGLLRKGEPEQVVKTFREQMGAELVAVEAGEEFFAALKGVTDPEQKRRIVGEKFIRIFEREAKKLGSPPCWNRRHKFLVQGTIYPDVVESAAPDRNKAARIKSHHNVGGLPEIWKCRWWNRCVTCSRMRCGRWEKPSGCPKRMVWRQPFPGPGLAVRCLGEVTPERVLRLRAADAIFTGGIVRSRAAGEGSRNQPGLCSAAAGTFGWRDGR